MENFIVIAIVLVVLMLYSTMKEMYHIRKDIYWWREDWETINKIDIKKASLEEQADFVKKIVVKITEPKK
ncbi:MAG: hypothetical protein WC870_03080 [Candidatus Paceibacterota bacterium]